MKNGREIIGYKTKRFDSSEVVPADAIFLSIDRGSAYICGSVYRYEHFLYNIPIYRTNINKRPNPTVTGF